MANVSSNNDNTVMIITAIIFIMSAVALGAFGAHGLKSIVTPERLVTWQTAVDYQMSQGLGLLLISLFKPAQKSGWYRWCQRLLTVGVVIFSGSLYLLVLNDIAILGAITPIGGIALILAWICLIGHFIKHHN